jgi:competence protein ComEC
MLFRRRWPREILLKSGFLLFGFFYAALFAQARLSEELPKRLEGKDVDVIGVVAELPGSNEKGQRFAFEVEQAAPGVPGKILLSKYCEARSIPVHAGENWRFSVRLKRPHGNLNPGGFDYEAWLLERGIRATGYVREGNKLDDFVARPACFVEAAREKLRDRIYRALAGAPYRGVIAALLMGEQRAISEKEWQVFRRTGVIHLMSISGLHVTMIAGLIAWLAYRFWRLFPTLALLLPARKVAAFCGLVCAFCYALLAGYAVPTQRTVYMLAVVAAALWIGKASSPSIVLCWALFVVTLIDPWAVLSPGFWLSFLAVALILYTETARIGKRGWLKSWFSVQWAVTVGLVPALLGFFGQISLVSPLANAIAIPVISFVVVPLTLIGAALPFDFPFMIAHEIFSALMLLLARLSALPDAVWVQHAPPAWTIPVAALGIIWLLLPRGFPARWLGFSGFLPMLPVLPQGPQLLRLSVLDVGQGLSAVVQTRHHALLFDAGPAYGNDSDSGGRIILPFLRYSGIDRLDALVLSHEDMDHVGGAISVLDSIPVGRVLSSLPEGNLSHAGTRLPCSAGESWEWDDVRFDILNPERIRGGTRNERSCVLRVASKFGAILIAGDVESRTAERLARSANLGSEVLVAPHHGGRSPESFAHAVSPRYVVFSAGYLNRFSHPRKETVDLYGGTGSRIFRTDREGMVSFDFSRAGIAESSWRKSSRRNWYQEK